jgi:aminopeptidase N
MTNQRGILFSVIFFFFIQFTAHADNNNINRIPVKPLNYIIDLTIDYDTAIITGTCRLTVQNITDEKTDHITLLLYRLLKVADVTDENDMQLSYSQGVETFADNDKMQVNFITVQLHDPLPPSGSTTITIYYSGYLFGYVETGMVYVQDSITDDFTIIRMDSFAYPIAGYPSWQSLIGSGIMHHNYEYEISVTVPSRFTVANVGDLTSKSTLNDVVTYSYRNIKPAWRMDIAIAKYDVLEKDKLRIFYFPDDEDGAERIMTEMEETVRLFTQWFGPLYDYRGFTVIQVPPGYGSQADVTGIIQTADAFRDEDHIVEFYHELSHLWNAPDNDEFTPRWNEGLAMFLQYLVLEKRKAQAGIIERSAEHSRRSFRRQYANSPQAHSIPMIDYGKERLTNLSYSKGKLFFYVYYNIVGEEEFLKSIGNYYQTYVRTGARTDEFLEFIMNSSSMDISQFVHDWFYTVDIDEEILGDIPLQDLVDRYR